MNNLRQKCYQVSTQALSHGHIIDLDELLLEFDELNNTQREQIHTWYKNVFEVGYIYSLLSSDMLEIHFHNYQNVTIHKNNKENETLRIDLEPEDFQLSLEIMTLVNEQKWNQLNPFVSFTFNKNNMKLRATLTHECISATKNSKLFLRVLQKSNFQFQDYGISPVQKSFFEEIIRSKKNIIISGSTASGKTSFLKLLLSLIDEKKHLCILEDTHELYTESPYFTHLLQNENSTLKDYCAYALRMSPERIILGEIRSHEIVPFVLAMNSGHQGILSSIHANNAEDTLHRMALLFNLFSESKEMTYELVLGLICKNVDYIVHMENKKVNEVIKVVGSEGPHIYFESIDNIRPELVSYTSIA